MQHQATRGAARAQVRELEEEVEALQAGRAHRAKLMALMEKKALVGDLFNQLRLARAPPGGSGRGTGTEALRSWPWHAPVMSRVCMLNHFTAL